MVSTLTINNPTYFKVPTITRSKITVSNPDLFTSGKQKREGYETRLFYEYEYTKKVGGWSQFITLTFNNKHLPKFFGIPCLDNSLIRSLFHDVRFFKDMKKKRGYQFKYFVGSEFGEGKGKRKKGENPHYHINLFITPVQNWKPYVDKSTGEVYSQYLDPSEVATAIKNYWQGLDKEGKPILNPKKFAHGLVSFGSVDVNGVIQDFRGATYASKYCVKDAYFKKKEKELSILLSKIIQKRIENSTPFDEIDVDKIKKEFRTRCSGRVLCSHGLGISAVDNIVKFYDPVSFAYKPKLKVDTAKGSIYRTIPLYIYRKLFYDVKKDYTGTYYYSLNEDGIKYKKCRLLQDIKESAESLYDNLSYLFNNPLLFENYLNSDDHDKTYPYSFADTFTHKYYLKDSHLEQFRTLLEENPRDDTTNVFFAYSTFNKVYKDRRYRFGSSFCFDNDSVLSEYEYSLSDVHLPCNDSRLSRSSFDTSLTCSYNDHPYFSQWLGLFAWFDNVNSYFTIQNDKEEKRKYDEYQKLKKLQNSIKYGQTQFC